MARKYLDRKQNSDEKKSEEFSKEEDFITKSDSEMENLDPLNVEDRTVIFRNNPTIKKTQDENTKNPVNDVEQFVRTINSQLVDRDTRIEKIKQYHKNFEREIESIRNNKRKSTQDEKIEEIVNGVIGELETVKTGKELSSMIEKFAVEKLDMLKKLIESEKRQSRELNEKLQINLLQIAEAEERMKHQRSKLESELRSKTKKLVQAERLSAIGELSARLAHDLRNPLTVIKGTVDIMKSKKIEKDVNFSQKQIVMMDRAILRMSHQIDDVLQFVKVQTLRTSQNSILETIGLSVAKLKKFETIIYIPENDVEFVYDSDKLEVVFDNLLSNAIESMDGKGEIEIRLNELENEVEIELEDSGSGVPDELLPKIFEPLFTTKQRGTGLGLASCKSIIEQHEGSLSVQNNPSIFTIKLPKMLEISTI